MKKLVVLIFAGLLGLGVVLGEAPRVCAGESDTDEFMLEEVTVTAQKREENQQKVATAMEVITAGDLRQSGRTELDDILSSVSAAMVSRSADGLRVTIRGISDDDDDMMGQAQSMPTVSVNTDGVRSNRKDRASALFDIERVEILYGPQSTLYSSNSPGGIVNILTAQPKLEGFEGNASIELGNYNLIKGEGMLNTPLNDQWALRTAFSVVKRDGYLSSGEDDEDNKAVRLRTLYQASDDFSIIATAQFNKRGGLGRGGGVIGFVNQDDVDDPWEARGSAGAFASSIDDRRQDYYLTMDWTTKLGAITVVPQYQSTVIDSVSEVTNGPAAGYIREQKRDQEEKGIEARIASIDESDLKWIFGYNYYESDDYNHYWLIDFPEWEHITNRQKAHSVFGNITYALNDSLRLVTGARYSKDEVTGQGEANKMAQPVPGVAERPYVIMVTDYVMKYSEPDWKVGFEYDLAPQSMLFADWTTSYRVRAFGGVGADPVPEKLNAYTVGTKNRFFNNRLQVNASAFYYDYENYPASEALSVWYDDNGDGVMQRDETASDPHETQYGRGRHIGFDLQTSAVITSQSVLNVSWSYLDSKWTDLLFDYYYDWTHSIDAETGEVIVLPIEDLNYKGKSMTNSPPHTITVNYMYNFLLPRGSSINTNINARYQTGYRISWKDEYYPGDYQEAHRLIDVSAEYGSASGKYSLSFYVKNLENYAVKRSYKPPQGPDPSTLTISAPRTYGAIFKVKF